MNFQKTFHFRVDFGHLAQGGCMIARSASPAMHAAAASQQPCTRELASPPRRCPPLAEVADGHASRARAQAGPRHTSWSPTCRHSSGCDSRQRNAVGRGPTPRASWGPTLAPGFGYLHLRHDGGMSHRVRMYPSPPRIGQNSRRAPTFGPVVDLLHPLATLSSPGSPSWIPAAAAIVPKGRGSLARKIDVHGCNQCKRRCPPLEMVPVSSPHIL